MACHAGRADGGGVVVQRQRDEGTFITGSVGRVSSWMEGYRHLGWIDARGDGVDRGRGKVALPLLASAKVTPAPLPPPLITPPTTAQKSLPTYSHTFLLLPVPSLGPTLLEGLVRGSRPFALLLSLHSFGFASLAPKQLVTSSINHGDTTPPLPWKQAWRRREERGRDKVGGGVRGDAWR